MRLIEDSGGRLTFGNCYDEKYLNTVLEEAETNKAVFFRALGGNPTIPSGESTLAKPVQAAYNGKFTADAKKPCALYNMGKKEHVGDCITLDGTCRRVHACSQWVSSGQAVQKGPKGEPSLELMVEIIRSQQV